METVLYKVLCDTKPYEDSRWFVDEYELALKRARDLADIGHRVCIVENTLGTRTVWDSVEEDERWPQKK